MNVLVIGQGGREHAIVRALSLSPSVKAVHALPGNSGMLEARCHALDPKDFPGVLEVCVQNKVDLVVVGPEDILALGLADFLRENNISVFGPGTAASQLEASKIRAKEFMAKHKVPTAAFDIVDSVASLGSVMDKYKPPYVLKADGLAGGKGVFICQSADELLSAGAKLFEDKIFGEAGQKAIIEAFQPGYELSFFFMTNGKDYVPLLLAQDHKRLKDGDLGPNTGGMGTVAPVAIVPELLDQILSKVIEPTVRGLNAEGFVYNGVVFVGLMITEEGPTVIEYNIRFGDPETQVLLPLMSGDWGEAFANIAQGEIPKLEWKTSATSCVVLAAENYPASPVKGAEIRGDLSPKTDSYFLHAGTKQDGDVCKTNGGRVLNAMGTGESLSDAIRASYRAIEKVSWSGMQYRKDIGKQFYQE